MGVRKVLGRIGNMGAYRLRKCLCKKLRKMVVIGFAHRLPLIFGLRSSAIVPPPLLCLLSLCHRTGKIPLPSRPPHLLTLQPHNFFWIFVQLCADIVTHSGSSGYQFASILPQNSRYHVETCVIPDICRYRTGKAMQRHHRFLVFVSFVYTMVLQSCLYRSLFLANLGIRLATCRSSQ